MTKSGQIGGNFSFSSSVKASHLSNFIQAALGERIAPFAKIKPTSEPKTTPCDLSSFQFAN